ncbi:hypothetical protein [Thermoactinospora rubra]|uniref:hypothetical protein n=1 Tax=Thermoactinospora rubra TaxID=1088767 RepID=UPI000A121462|nr:hypothetical protein [Thermoactinospora rubra]
MWTYEKVRPVPGMDQFETGDGRVPTADTPIGRLSNVICFDADFPDLMREPVGVDLMLVPANDWDGFGATHTEKAVMRAVENGYGLVRQDSNGLAAAFDHQGRMLASADYFAADQQTMVAQLPVKGTTTVFAWLCALGLLAIALARFHTRKETVTHDPHQQA